MTALMDRLTPRETEVLAAMAAGHTNSAIAEALCLSRKAVEKHINSIFSKLCLTGADEHHPRVRAVLMYIASEAQPCPPAGAKPDVVVAQSMRPGRSSHPYRPVRTDRRRLRACRSATSTA